MIEKLSETHKQMIWFNQSVPSDRFNRVHSAQAVSVSRLRFREFFPCFQFNSILAIGFIESFRSDVRTERSGEHTIPQTERKIVKERQRSNRKGVSPLEMSDEKRGENKYYI